MYLQSGFKGLKNLVFKSSDWDPGNPEDSSLPINTCPSKCPKKVFAGLVVFKLMWGNPGALFEKIKEFHFLRTFSEKEAQIENQTLIIKSWEKEVERLKTAINQR